MNQLQAWYELSHYEVEGSENDSISFSYFCCLNIGQEALYHSKLTHFPTAMRNTWAYEQAFKKINTQLRSDQIIIKKRL